MPDQHESGNTPPVKGASEEQNLAEASDGRASSVRGIMRRNREHGEDGKAAASQQRLSGLSDDKLLATWRSEEPGSELHDLIAAELERRNLDH